MDTARRRAYLTLMGVTLYRPRGEVDPIDTTSAPPVAEGEGEGRPTSPPPALPRARTEQALDWEGLRAQVADCHACQLWQTRTQTVFGVGNQTARLMVIGEAPGADEDRQGEPFVGRAGQLLNAMLAAIGQPREQVYIANVLKCRPPGNRDPKPEEAQQCEDFLLRQIEWVAPRLILAVGRIAAQHLLQSGRPVGELRGVVHRFGLRAIPLVVCYHPAYLLRSPEQKANAWKDLKLALRQLQLTNS
ncbi:uracil-DNA glycosylase [Gammaproteobacteria bacterium]